jgi:hypothetical protein
MMKPVSKVFALVLPLLVPALVHAGVQEVPLGVTPDNEEYNELRQSVALLADGSYASVWTERGGAHDARIQWVRPDGSEIFAGGGRSITASTAQESDAVVASNPAGGAFAALSRGTGDGADGRQVFVQSFDAAGNSRWLADGVFAAAAGHGDQQIEPQLIAAPQGGVYLCFQNFHSIGGRGSDIVCQRFSAAGQRLWTDQGVTAGGQSGFKALPKLVRDNRNGPMVFWRNGRFGFLSPQDHILIEGQHLAPDGSRNWGAQGRIIRTTNLPASTGHAYSSLGAVSDGQGGAVLSFDDGLSGGNLDVFAQRVTGDGRLLWRNGATVAAGSAYQVNDSVTAAPDGGAFITVWQPQPGPEKLWLYRLGPDGKIRWRQQLSSTDSGYPSTDGGAYGSFDNGRLRIAWNHFRQDGSGTIDVYLAIFDLAGHRLNGPIGTPLTSAQNSQILRGFVFDPARKQGLAVWNDYRKGGPDDPDTVGGLYKE